LLQVFAAEGDSFSILFSFIAWGLAGLLFNVIVTAVFPNPNPWVEMFLTMFPALAVSVLAYYGLVLLRGDEVKGLEEIRTERRRPRLRELFRGKGDSLSLAAWLWATLGLNMFLESLYLDSLERWVPNLVADLILLGLSLLAGLLVYIPVATWRRRVGPKEEEA
jgi:hypothetical protein